MLECWGYGFRLCFEVLGVEPGRREDELAVREVADAHVDAEDFVFIMALLLLLWWLVGGIIGRVVKGLG